MNWHKYFWHDTYTMGSNGQTGLRRTHPQGTVLSELSINNHVMYGWLSSCYIWKCHRYIGSCQWQCYSVWATGHLVFQSVTQSNYCDSLQVWVLTDRLWLLADLWSNLAQGLLEKVLIHRCNQQYTVLLLDQVQHFALWNSFLRPLLKCSSLKQKSRMPWI